MTTSEIPFTEDCLMQMLVEEFDISPDRLRPDDTLAEMGLDSLDLLGILVALDARTGKEVSGEELPITLRTSLAEAARIVCRAVAKARSIGWADAVE
ncbi:MULTISPECIES: acyl carrier protein [unclassified Streptomyces]|uniref:acyl carrier protein n=1 Tax=unclassified Streptomyces TaxID=2593676 RepID=UPI002E334F2F|nr:MULTISPECIES: acyl carrier protein [unclassified Streptomyces]